MFISPAFGFFLCLASINVLAAANAAPSPYEMGDLGVPHEARMVILGVALHDHIILDSTALTGELAEPTLIAGVMQPADTVVRLDLATGSAETTTRSSIVDP